MTRFHQFVTDGEGWETKRVEVSFENPYLQIQKIQVTSPSRSEAFEWTVCHRKGGVAVAAQTPEGGFVMIRQERVPFRESFWEFPAGQIEESQGHDQEAIIATGMRELEEEAGYALGQGGEVESLHYYASSPGFTDEHVYMLWVRGVVPALGGSHQDPGESILEVRVFSGAEIVGMVRSGTIRDANTLCCLARLGAFGAWASNDRTGIGE